MARDLSPQKLRKLEEEKKTTISVNHPGEEFLEAEEGLQSNKDDAKHRRNMLILLVVSLVFTLFCILMPSGIFSGYSEVDSVGKLFEQISTNVSDFFAALAGTHTGGFYETTICKFVCTFVCGAVLGACGAVLQGSFRNPLASPSTLGVVAGCVLGAVFYYIFLHEDLVSVASASISTLSTYAPNLNPLEYVWLTYGRAICSVLGGMLVVGIAILISRTMGGGSLNNVVVIVVGQVFALVLDSSVDALRYYFDISGQHQRSVLIQMADSVPFDKVQLFADLAFVCIPLIIGLVVMFLLRNRMNVLTFSDEEARSFGVNIGKFRTGMMLLCAFMTGVVVAFCGPVAFVGFVAPHVVRRVVGTNYRYLLPGSMFVGAILLTLALFITSQFDLNINQGVNLITSSVGCLVFVAVVFTGRGGAHAWR